VPPDFFVTRTTRIVSNGARLARLARDALALQSFVRREFFFVGPTAIGKSSLAVDVAKKLGAEIVNADAFQIYRGLDILTAKPDFETQQSVPHHLLSVVELSEEMSAAKFRELALAALDEIRARGKIVFVVSGSGLYVKALARGFDAASPPNPTLRAELSALSREELARRLLQLDPELAARTDSKNPRRVIRAIEIAEASTPREKIVPSEIEGSRHVTSKVTPRDPSTSLRSARDDGVSARGIFIVRDRADLYRRINERVFAMFRQGVEEEVASLNNVGPTATQALGLREIRQLLAGEISRDDCIAKIQQATRRYAKRQLTWFRHQTNFPELNLTALSHQEAISAITHAIAQK
jgi:tRNA dimethylallyltransferase